MSDSDSDSDSSDSNLTNTEPKSWGDHGDTILAVINFLFEPGSSLYAKIYSSVFAWIVLLHVCLNLLCMNFT